MPAGRPSEYDEAFCDVAHDWLARGYSLAVVAGQIGVSRQTVDAWTKVHPEFLDAVMRGRALGAFIWEERLGKLADSGVGNANAIIFGLKNRQGDDWRDKTETEHSGGLDVHHINRTLVDPRNPDS